MDTNNKDNIPAEIQKLIQLFERRSKIIEHNNNSILEVAIFYENFFFFNIIKKTFFNENFDNNKKIKKFITERMNFTDKYEIIKELAKKYNIETISNSDFEFFIKIRNNIAHNLSSVNSYNRETDETHLVFGGEPINWNEYLKKIAKWATISYKIAEFTKKVFQATNNTENSHITFRYCKVIGNCALIQYSLLLKEPEEEYTCFAKTGISSEILKCINEENTNNITI